MKYEKLFKSQLDVEYSNMESFEECIQLSRRSYMLYFNWDTADFQKALSALILNSPVNGNFSPFVLYYCSYFTPSLPKSHPLQFLHINLSVFLNLEITFIFAIFAFPFISLFGISLLICLYSKTKMLRTYSMSIPIAHFWVLPGLIVINHY